MKADPAAQLLEATTPKVLRIRAKTHRIMILMSNLSVVGHHVGLCCTSSLPATDWEIDNRLPLRVPICSFCSPTPSVCDTVQMPKKQQRKGEENTTALKVPGRSLSRVLVEPNPG